MVYQLKKGVQVLKACPKKVGLLLGSLAGAGAEKTILTLSRALRSEGADVTLFLLDSMSDYALLEDEQICIVEGKNKKQKQKHLNVLSKEGKFDLFVTSRAEYYDCIVATKMYCSVHITPTAWITNPKWQFWEIIRKKSKLKRKFRHKNIIALSAGIKNDLVNNLGVKPELITLINNPFDIHAMNILASRNGNIPIKPYILYVASFIPRKRHVDLLNAFAQMKDKTHDLVLLGKGGLELELRKLVISLGLSKRVIFWGWDDNPYCVIKNSALSVLCSEAEGLPRTLVEAMLLNVPVVSTDCPSGPSELLEGEFSNYLVPVGNIDKMQQAMDLALHYFPDYAQLNLQRFQASNVAKRYLSELL
jgi:glycosyltransferase involved in cell wall biosynthesis